MCGGATSFTSCTISVGRAVINVAVAGVKLVEGTWFGLRSLDQILNLVLISCVYWYLRVGRPRVKRSTAFDVENQLHKEKVRVHDYTAVSFIPIWMFVTFPLHKPHRIPLSRICTFLSQLRHFHRTSLCDFS